MKLCKLGFRSCVHKYLTVEHLEKRQLLAADCVPYPEEMALGGSATLVAGGASELNQPTMTEAERNPRQDGAFSLSSDEQLLEEGKSGWSLNSIPEEVGEFSQDADSVAAVLNFNPTSDAGSTRLTARDLGVIGTPQSLNGSLSYFDRLDVFRFDITTDSNVSLGIDGMWGNADLILADSDGRGIASSRNAGTASESIQTELEPGVYYVASQARSFWGTNYQLRVSANPIADPADTDADKPESSEGEGGFSGSAEALPEVPYFGTQRDWNLNSVNAPKTYGGLSACQDLTQHGKKTG